MATWPSQIKITRKNYKESPPNRVIKTEMETGIAKKRRRTSKAKRPLELMLFLNDDDLEVFDTFYLDNDALRFDFTDPRTDEVVKARFESPPEYTARETMWDISVSLEIVG